MFYPKIAVIGSGPAGLYSCSRLLQKLPKCQIDVFDRNLVPYGLVYYGVAPDHSNMKKCTNQFEKMFINNRDRLSLYCNVSFGTDIKYDEICNNYDAIVLAYGASKARQLNIKNENAINCFSGSDFVSWYNGQPKNSSKPILDNENAIVIGNGNVAIDCSRILLSSIKKLSHTDLPENALKTLRQSSVNNVKILGRRGPLETSFTIKELRELLTLHNCSTECIIPEEIVADLNVALETIPRPRKRILELMLSYKSPKINNETSKKKCSIEFFKKIKSIITNNQGRVSEIEIENTLSSSNNYKKTTTIPCGLLIYAIGFENIILPGLPQTEDNRLKMLDWCRVPNETTNVYATGWCANSARGVIADSQRQAHAVADELSEDCKKGVLIKKKKSINDIKKLLVEKGIEYISWEDWCLIDECERRMGMLLGKPREKLNDMLTLLKIRNTY